MWAMCAFMSFISIASICICLIIIVFVLFVCKKSARFHFNNTKRENVGCSYFLPYKHYKERVTLALGLEGEELRFNIELTDILTKPYRCITLNILHDLLHKKFTYFQLMLESDQNVAVFLLKE